MPSPDNYSNVRISQSIKDMVVELSEELGLSQARIIDQAVLIAAPFMRLQAGEDIIYKLLIVTALARTQLDGNPQPEHIDTALRDALEASLELIGEITENIEAYKRR